MSDDKPAASVPPEPSRIALTRPGPTVGRPGWVHGIGAGVCLYFFVSAINVMGGGLKIIGHETEYLEQLLALGQNPFVALMASVLITSIVQSSSFTTALIITMTGTGFMDVQTAVYAVMGANIGTSVTNIIVALGQIRIRRQFRRAFTAALVHDIFNWLTVAILFPVEWISSAAHGSGKGLLLRFAEWLGHFVSVSDLEKPFNPVKWASSPVIHSFKWCASLVNNDPITQGVLIAIFGLILLFASLFYLVKNLKGAFLRQIEGLFRSFFFRNDAIAYVVGAFTTVLVQSSSVTTSLIVPLAGAGAVRISRVFAYTLGANLGTTFTGVIAATANPVPEAVAVAIAHVTFNLIGTVIWYPLKTVPISLAYGFGRIASRSKRYAILFLLLVFFVIPALGLILTELFG